MRKALLQADVHFKVVKNLISGVARDALGEKVIGKVDPESSLLKFSTTIWWKF